ncbi:MAG: VOC family protein [Bacteroidetes bacterium]|nr:VOC family protein [Bacteroidota bacterium]
MRIKEIILFSNSIQKQKQFYKDVLGFELILDSAKKISFKTGKTILSFQYKETFKTSHFAFNIPSNKEVEALSWLEKRVEILPHNNNSIVDFKSWNAKAIYFYDADKNIVEFIARKNLNITTNSEFSSGSILSISEMAIATDDVESIYNTINKMRQIPVFDGDFNRFCAIGDEEGLFILIDKNKKKWFPTMETAFTSDFVIRSDYNFVFENGKITELS